MWPFNFSLFNLFYIIAVHIHIGSDIQEMERQDKWCDPVPMDSESPLFVIYTSGTTDQPIGIEHSTAGYLLHVALSHKVE